MFMGTAWCSFELWWVLMLKEDSRILGSVSGFPRIYGKIHSCTTQRTVSNVHHSLGHVTFPTEEDLAQAPLSLAYSPHRLVPEPAHDFSRSPSRSQPSSHEGNQLPSTGAGHSNSTIFHPWPSPMALITLRKASMLLGRAVLNSLGRRFPKRHV